MTHETTVHGADAQITVGRRLRRPVSPRTSPPTGSTNGPADGPWPLPTAPSLTCGPQGLAAGDSLHVHAADVPEGTGEWVVSHGPAGITVRRAHEKATVALRGGASDLLLVLLRRLPADDPGVGVHGDPAVLDRWLAATGF